MHALGARGAGRERVEAPLVEGAYGIPHRLRSAPKVFGDLRRSVSAGARKQDLAPAHHEGIFGAQPGFEPFALLFRQIPDKNWRFHGGNYRLFHTTLSEDALGGHSDALGGVLCGPQELVRRVYHYREINGAALDPFAAAYLLIRGLKTLELRVARHNENAMKIARFLEGHPMVERVFYPGLESHPQHELAKR